MARTVPAAVAAVAAVAVVPSVVVSLKGGHDFTGALFAASVIAGAGAGYATEDPAAPTLASSPTTLAVRRSLRAVAVGAVLLSAWIGARLIAAAGGGHAPPMDPLAAELAASAALSIAFASRGRPDAPVSSGAGAAGGAVLAMVTISSLARNWPTLPSIAVVSHHERWWWVAAAALATVAWSWRDPAARSRRAVRFWCAQNGVRTAEADRTTVP
jgi:hypothetical protein